MQGTAGSTPEPQEPMTKHFWYCEFLGQIRIYMCWTLKISRDKPSSAKPLDLEAQSHRREFFFEAWIHSSDRTVSDNCALAEFDLAQDETSGPRSPTGPTGPVSVVPEYSLMRLPLSTCCFLGVASVWHMLAHIAPSLPKSQVGRFAGRSWGKVEDAPKPTIRKLHPTAFMLLPMFKAKPAKKGIHVFLVEITDSYRCSRCPPRGPRAHLGLEFDDLVFRCWRCPSSSSSFPFNKFPSTPNPFQSPTQFIALQTARLQNLERMQKCSMRHWRLKVFIDMSTSLVKCPDGSRLPAEVKASA